MGRITVVFTVHNERGACTKKELVGILESVGPAVVFEEIRPSDFDAFYRVGLTLETRAVAEYVRARPACQVPVDQYESHPENIDSVFDYAERNNVEYRALIAERDSKTDHLGFPYLNSSEFAATSKRACASLESTIAMSGSDGLKKILTTWNSLLRGRETSMLDNIYAFCRTAHFKEGVFLVGAEHMAPIVEGVESTSKTEPNLIEWNFWNRLRPFKGAH